jgi:3-oxoacyl-[acyl-carrier-protein] synthase III
VSAAQGTNARRGLPHSSLIAATSYAYPSELVSNAAFAARCEFAPTTSFDELAAASGVRTRRWCAPAENTRTLTDAAVARLLAEEPELCQEVDLVVVASGTTLNMAHPSDPDNRSMADLSPFVLEKLGRSRALGLDIKACYCSGFLRGVQVVDALLANENYRAALLVAVEQGSRFAVAPSNRSSFCFIVADAAGAVVFRRAERREGTGVIDYVGHTEVDKRSWVGIGEDAVSMTMLGSKAADATRQLLVECGRTLLWRNGLTPRDVSWLLPIQTHAGLLAAVLGELEWPRERMLWSGDVNGFSGSASIPSCLAEQARLGRVRRGELVLSLAVGAGLNCAGALYRY